MSALDFTSMLRGRRASMTVTVHEAVLAIIDQIAEAETLDHASPIRRSWVVESLLLDHPEIKKRLTHG